MQITKEQAKVVAERWSELNGSVLGNFGKCESVKEKTLSDGSIAHYICVMENGAIIVPTCDSMSPILAASHNKSAWDNSSNAVVTKLSTGIMGKTAKLESESAALKASSNQATGDGGDPDASNADVIRNRWSTLLKKNATLKLAAASGAADATTSSDDELTPATVYSVCDGWKTQAIGPSAGGRDLSFWAQEYPFNKYTPDNDVAGCVAIAMATIENFYQSPDGVDTFTEPVRGSETTHTSIAGSYDWSNLTDDLKGRVAYNAGVAVKMDYGESCSAAYFEDVPNAMTVHHGFKQAQNITIDNEANLGTAFFNQVLYPWLRVGWPVNIAIDSETASIGHSVCAVGSAVDATGTDLTYVSVGWGGEGDAWYALPEITTHSKSGEETSKYTIVDSTILMSPVGRYVVVSGTVTCSGTPATGDISVYAEANDEVKSTAVMVGNKYYLPLNYDTLGGSFSIVARSAVPAGSKLNIYKASSQAKIDVSKWNSPYHEDDYSWSVPFNAWSDTFKKDAYLSGLPGDNGILNFTLGDGDFERDVTIGVAPQVKIKTETGDWVKLPYLKGETGPTGQTGTSGVEIAATAPTGDAKVWINTSGETYELHDGTSEHPFTNPFYVKVGDVNRKCTITGSSSAGFTLSIT